MILIAFFIFKIMIYALWFYVAIKYVASQPIIFHLKKWKSALIFALIRIVIGLVIGLFIWRLTDFIFDVDYSNRLGMNWFNAFLALILSHSISWLITLKFMLPHTSINRKWIAWLVGGIVISCVMDTMLLIIFPIFIGIC